MSHGPIRHALGLHMHQPPGNLRLLIESNEWEAQQIVRCYERAARYAHKYADVGRLHVGFSGVLLEQFRDPEIIEAYRELVDIPAMLDSYRTATNIELIGMGYYHPIFPLIPRADWAEQLDAGRRLMAETFGRAPRGFWPPEMAFTMEMIPALVAAGYEYVVVDGVHVRPEGEEGPVDIYRPYIATFDGASITVVPRDRDVSNAQESGLDASWFADEVRAKVAGSPAPDAPRLITTWSDGENGGWFRQTDEFAGFFGHYFSPYMEHVRTGAFPARPVSIAEYLADNPPTAEATVRTGAWNVGNTSGEDLSQWAGSPAQQKAVDTVAAVSRRYHAAAARAAGLSPAGRDALAKVRALVLEGETSCFLFWGDDWIPQLYERTGPAETLLDRLESGALDAATAPAPANEKPVAVKPSVAPPAVGATTGTPPAAPTPKQETAPAPKPEPEPVPEPKPEPVKAAPPAKAPAAKPTAKAVAATEPAAGRKGRTRSAGAKKPAPKGSPRPRK